MLSPGYFSLEICREFNPLVFSLFGDFRNIADWFNCLVFASFSIFFLICNVILSSKLASFVKDLTIRGQQGDDSNDYCLSFDLAELASKIIKD